MKETAHLLWALDTRNTIKKLGGAYFRKQDTSRSFSKSRTSNLQNYDETLATLSTRNKKKFDTK